VASPDWSISATNDIARTDLELTTAGTRTLDELVQLVGLAARLADLGDDDIRVDAAPRPFRRRRGPRTGRRALDGNEAMLFGVIEPVTGPAGADERAELIRLEPDDLVDALEAARSVQPRVEDAPPLGEADATELHRAAGDPEEEQAALVLQLRHRQRDHFVVGERCVRQSLRPQIVRRRLRTWWMSQGGSRMTTSKRGRTEQSNERMS